MEELLEKLYPGQGYKIVTADGHFRFKATRGAVKEYTIYAENDADMAISIVVSEPTKMPESGGKYPTATFKYHR